MFLTAAIKSVTIAPMVPQRLRPSEQHLLALVPPDAQLGPAMAGLSERHRVFVMARISGRNQADSAKLAGYEGQNPKSLEVTGCRLDNDARIQSAYDEELRRGIRASSALLTLPVLKEIITDPKQAARDRIAAIRILLERSVPIESTVNVNHTHTLTREQTIQEIVQHMRLKGEDPRRVLGWIADAAPSDAVVLEGQVTTERVAA